METYKIFKDRIVRMIADVKDTEHGTAIVELLNKNLELPKCVTIDSTVFLVNNEIDGSFKDPNGDFNPSFELMDMTEEIKSANSQSFYVSCLGFFKESTEDERFMVKNFLATLREPKELVKII